MDRAIKKQILERLFLILFFLITIYLILSSAILVSLFAKYRFINIKNIEPINYTPNLKNLEVKEEVQATSFNIYHCHINRFGSRNSFEVTSEDKNIVVLLGDSFFWGSGLNDNETIAHFLNSMDTKRKYINLALPGANICDSVARYLSKYERMQAPPVIIFQVLLFDDVYASTVIEAKIAREVNRDYRYVWYPFRRFISRKFLFRHYMSQIVEKIFADLTDSRFTGYIQNPLRKLIKKVSQSGTAIILIAYDDNYHGELKSYPGKLKRFCLENGIPFFEVNDLVTEECFTSRLQDGHPSAILNRALAAKIKEKVTAALALR